MLKQRFFFVLCVLVLATMPFATNSASAQVLSCAQLNANPILTADPTIISKTVTLVTTGVTVPYCSVTVYISERGGSQYGYAAGQNQRVGVIVGLPASTADGGSGGGVQGAWNGRVENLGGDGAVGALGSVTGATNANYVGSFTDSGHTGSSFDFGVIQGQNLLNLGQISDFFSDSLRLQYQWALRLTKAYYGMPAQRNYWNGCSEGGGQGLREAVEHGDDFDGFLVGAPHIEEAEAGAAGTWKTWVNEDVAAASITNAKYTATTNLVIAACVALGGIGVTDGILSDPRTCKVSATVNLCGAPGAVSATCITSAQAQAIDMVNLGPTNALGVHLWSSNGPGTAASLTVSSPYNGANELFGWAAKDLTFSWLPLPLSNFGTLTQNATNVVGPYTDGELQNLDLVRNRGGKILMWQGTYDPQPTFGQSIWYYQKTADYYGGLANIQPWFQYFLAPGVGHCSGGVGPQPQNLFQTMVNWVENGTTPAVLASGGTVPAGGSTLPLCAFPQYAVWNGVGAKNVASSYSCGGNLQTHAALCGDLQALYQHEAGDTYDPVGGVNAASCGLTTTAKTAPVISWPAPASILFGSALSAGQLNATANVPGTFTYNPAPGTPLTAGNGQTLTASFIPSDTSTYALAQASTQINVVPNPVGGLVVSSTLARVGGDVSVTLNFSNTTSTAIQNVTLTSAMFAGASAEPLPKTIGTIPAGGVVRKVVTLIGLPGTSGVLSLSGTYTGGTFGSSVREVLPAMTGTSGPVPF